MSLCIALRSAGSRGAVEPACLSNEAGLQPSGLCMVACLVDRLWTACSVYLLGPCRRGLITGLQAGGPFFTTVMGPLVQVGDGESSVRLWVGK